MSRNEKFQPLLRSRWVFRSSKRSLRMESQNIQKNTELCTVCHWKTIRWRITFQTHSQCRRSLVT